MYQNIIFIFISELIETNYKKRFNNVKQSKQEEKYVSKYYFYIYQ